MDTSKISTYLIYNARHRILICRHCRYVINPSGVKRHLRNEHLEWELCMRRQLTEYAATLDLISVKDACAIQLGPEPIEGLDVKQGLYCEECQYICVTVETMIKHCRSSHQWIQKMGCLWAACHVQRLFKGGENRKYFCVVGPREEDGTMMMEDLIRTLIEGKDRAEQEQENQLTIVRGTQNKVDMTPWMQRTGWLRMFVGRDMQSLASFSHKPSKTEPELTIL